MWNRPFWNKNIRAGSWLVLGFWLGCIPTVLSGCSVGDLVRPARADTRPLAAMPEERGADVPCYVFSIPRLADLDAERNLVHWTRHILESDVIPLPKLHFVGCGAPGKGSVIMLGGSEEPFHPVEVPVSASNYDKLTQLRLGASYDLKDAPQRQVALQRLAKERQDAVRRSAVFLYERRTGYRAPGGQGRPLEKQLLDRMLDEVLFLVEQGKPLPGPAPATPTPVDGGGAGLVGAATVDGGAGPGSPPTVPLDGGSAREPRDMAHASGAPASTADGGVPGPAAVATEPPLSAAESSAVDAWIAAHPRHPGAPGVTDEEKATWSEIRGIVQRMSPALRLAFLVLPEPPAELILLKKSALDTVELGNHITRVLEAEKALGVEVDPQLAAILAQPSLDAAAWNNLGALQKHKIVYWNALRIAVTKGKIAFLEQPLQTLLQAARSVIDPVALNEAIAEAARGVTDPKATLGSKAASGLNYARLGTSQLSTWFLIAAVLTLAYPPAAVALLKMSVYCFFASVGLHAIDLVVTAERGVYASNSVDRKRLIAKAGDDMIQLGATTVSAVLLAGLLKSFKMGELRAGVRALRQEILAHPSTIPFQHWLSTFKSTALPALRQYAAKYKVELRTVWQQRKAWWSSLKSGKDFAQGVLRGDAAALQATGISSAQFPLFSLLEQVPGGAAVLEQLRIVFQDMNEREILVQEAMLDRLDKEIQGQLSQLEGSQTAEEALAKLALLEKQLGGEGLGKLVTDALREQGIAQSQALLADWTKQAETVVPPGPLGEGSGLLSAELIDQVAAALERVQPGTDAGALVRRAHAWEQQGRLEGLREYLLRLAVTPVGQLPKRLQVLRTAVERVPTLMGPLNGKVILQGDAVSAIPLIRTSPAPSPSVVVPTGLPLRAFTESNFRDNLIQQTTGGLDPGKGVHAHHVFPKKHQKKFADAGMNIHDPQYGVWWDAQSHMKHARAYNDGWGEFFVKTPHPTLAEILQQGRKMMIKHGITVRYR